MCKDVRKLKAGCKYTLAGFSYDGHPYSVQFSLKYMREEIGGHWPESYLVKYRKLENNAICSVVLNQSKDFIIWEGLVNPNVDLGAMTCIKDSDHGHVQLLKRWNLHDPRYMVRAKLSVVQLPLIEHFKPIKSAERLFDLCTVIS